MPGKVALDLAEDKEIPRVLVCDDSQVTLTTAKALLERHGFFVATTYSAEEGLQELRKHSYDLVLLDIEMPGMSGLELTRILRAEQSDQVFLPIILLTARTDYESRMEGLKAGATDFLTKPFDPHELVARIRNFVASKRTHDRLVATNKALEEERAKVHRVQIGLLPRHMPEVPGLSFGALYRPCEAAGGDLYDAFVRANGNLLLTVGDVSGHGIPSAMYMAIARAVLHAEAAEQAPISTILERMDQVLRHGLDAFSFVTIYLAEYDPRTGLLEHISAGHPPPYLHDLKSGSITELDLHHTLPLGLGEELTLCSSKFQLQPGQRLIIYTDGVLEQANPEGAFFDDAGFVGALREGAVLPVERLPDFVMQRLLGFAAAPSTKDDVTMLVMEVQKLAGG